jgi:hypothetical protein
MSQPPLNPTPDPRLAELIEDAVADVDPVDRLAAIRSRTVHASESKVSNMTSRRSWTITAGAAVVAAAAVVVAVAVIGQQNNKPTSGPGPAASDSTSDGSSSSPAPSDPTSATSSPDGGGSSVYAMYFVGDTPFGPRLYREFQPVEGSNPAQVAVGMAIGGGALDPDYRTEWPADTTIGAVPDNGDVITVDLGTTSGSLRERPAGMSKADASIAVQQVIYTAQAFFGRGRAPVQLLIDGQHSDMVLGVPASEPLANDDPNDVLSLVSLTDPAEGTVVTGDTLHVSGVANSFEATVPWQILQGTKVVDEYSFMAEGAYDKLYPFEGTIDVSGLAPGTYTLRVATDDPSGGEGPGPFVDTRTFVIG